jgi:hypothetical protein
MSVIAEEVDKRSLLVCSSLEQPTEWCAAANSPFVPTPDSLFSSILQWLAGQDSVRKAC